jgi:hypothetical protein
VHAGEYPPAGGPDGVRLDVGDRRVGGGEAGLAGDAVGADEGQVDDEAGQHAAGPVVDRGQRAAAHPAAEQQHGDAGVEVASQAAVFSEAVTTVSGRSVGRASGDQLRGEALVDEDGLGVADQAGRGGRDPRFSGRPAVVRMARSVSNFAVSTGYAPPCVRRSRPCFSSSRRSRRIVSAENGQFGGQFCDVHLCARLLTVFRMDQDTRRGSDRIRRGSGRLRAAIAYDPCRIRACCRGTSPTSITLNSGGEISAIRLGVFQPPHVLPRERGRRRRPQLGHHPASAGSACCSSAGP